ncbi:MAG: hypothetical protein QOK30_2296 [Nocardioidaceae bacterium]|nr:hypothetical protein [Nocardioidaceae bacterium]
MWLRLVLAVVAGLVLVELVLVVVLWRLAPDRGRIRESLRLLPDVVRLLSRLARDETLPAGVRIRLWALLAYLALPIDLVPDFIPVVGYADDAILVAATLRSVARVAGTPALARHWPGTPQGLAAVRRLAGLPDPADPADLADPADP